MNWESILHWAAVVGGFAILALAAITVICIAFADRNAKPVQDDQFTPELPFPGPTIESGAVADRLYGRDLHEGRERA